MASALRKHVRQATVENLCAGRVLDRPKEVEDGFEALKQYVAGKAGCPPSRLAQDVYEYILGLEVFIAGAYRVVTREADAEAARLQPEPEKPLIIRV